jgi:cytochrome P450
MPIHEALRVVAETHLIALLVPNWLMHLPISRYWQVPLTHPVLLTRILRFKTTRIARARLSQYMREQVAERKAKVAAGGDLSPDAFTTLVKANQDESSKYQLDDQDRVCLNSSHLLLIHYKYC